MKITRPDPPALAEDRILSLIEQMMDVVPKGTALGLCDLISAMPGGYFIESGRAVMPEDEISGFDTGFKLAEASQAGIKRCVIRLATNCTFGKTPGEIPERTSTKGRTLTRHKAEMVRLPERVHGENTIPADPADKIRTMTDEPGQEMEVHIWNKVCFLERRLEKVEESKKEGLRHKPIKVMAIYPPAYDKPLLIGTPVLSLVTKFMGCVSLLRVYRKLENTSCLAVAGHIIFTIRPRCNAYPLFRLSLGRC